jgi:hypothetical protein
MTHELVALLLDRKHSKLNGNAVESSLSKAERVERRAVEAHQDKAPAVLHRIRILASKMAQSHWIGLMMLRFSKKFSQNLAELESLIHYGNSKAVWEIAYLTRKKAVKSLTPQEYQELQCLQLYHDSPEVLSLTRLKMKSETDRLSADESQELASLLRNPYRKCGVPGDILEMLWPQNGLSIVEPFQALKA